MNITYKTNGAATTKSMTEWYFGQGFVKNSTAAAILQHNTSSKTEFKFWQNGTGYMTVCIH